MGDAQGSAAPAATSEVKPQGDEGIKNLKEEMNRKFANLEKSNQSLISTLQAVVGSQKPKSQAPEPEKKSSYKDIWYDEPDATVSRIKEEAKQETLAVLHAQNASNAKKQGVIQSLYREFPELQDFDNPLTVKAVELFERMSDEDKQSPIAYKLAVKEAAEELSIKPKSKRKPVDDDNDSFALSGSGGTSRQRSARSKELDPATLEFARLVGMDIDDEKVVEGLKKSASRTNWIKWE